MPISAEDKILGALMRYDSKTATILLAAFIFVLLINAFRITPLAISDTDPSTYIIVPMLMLPVLALFMGRLRIVPKVARRDLIIGATFFAVFLAASVVLQAYFSYLFVGFRLDMLLFPLAIAGLVTVLFGLANLGRFKALMIYALFASPIVLVPIMGLAGSFTVFNTVIVYSILKLFMSSASYLPPISILANGYDIGIGQTCVSIGAFIGLVLFLIPLAYVYDGRARDKIVWMCSGVVLLLVLNLFRMGTITYTWITSGPSEVISLIHVFIGQILFYLAIIIMILIAGKFGLGFVRRKKEKAAKRRQSTNNTNGILLAVVFAVLYLALSANYLYNPGLSASELANQVPLNFTDPSAATFLSKMAGVPHYTSDTFTVPSGKIALVEYSNSSMDPKTPIVFYAGAFNQNLTANLLQNSTRLGELAFFDYHGSVARVYNVISNGTNFYLYAINLPYSLDNGSTVRIGVYGIIAKSVAQQSTPCTNYDVPYSEMLNTLDATAYNASLSSEITSAYCIGEKFTWYNES